jgi:hypothetical protein
LGERQHSLAGRIDSGTAVLTASLRDTYEQEEAKATAHLRRRNVRQQDIPERLLIDLAESADLQ